MRKLERDVKDKRKGASAELALERLRKLQEERGRDDYAENSALRARRRAARHEEEEARQLARHRGLGIERVEALDTEGEAEAKRAASIRMEAQEARARAEAVKKARLCGKSIIIGNQTNEKGKKFDALEYLARTSIF